MKKTRFTFAILFLSLLAQISCRESEDALPIMNQPSKVILVYPFENSECNEGTDSTEIESKVLFEWKQAAYTDDYELIVSNLLTAAQASYITSANKMPVVLERGTPYAWHVVSRSNSSDSTAQSETWKFYNAGVGIESYAPFPAEILSPAMAQTIAFPAGGITLDWSGDDVDNDIVAFDIYFGIANPPELLAENLQESTLTGVQVESDNIYYWSVTTRDDHGNSSSSGIFQFRIL